jgi:hypothetical protein
VSCEIDDRLWLEVLVRYDGCHVVYDAEGYGVWCILRLAGWYSMYGASICGFVVAGCMYEYANNQWWRIVA